MTRKSRKACIADMGKRRFQFVENEQLDIYYYVSGLEMTKISWKEIEKGTRPQFISYKDWKEYICNKYNGYTVEKLEEFYRYLNISKCKSEGMGEYSKLLASIFLTIIITCGVTGIIDHLLGKTFFEGAILIIALIEILIKVVAMALVMAVLVWFIIKMMPDYTEEAIHKQFYNDYQEIIQEMIVYKKMNFDYVINIELSKNNS